jgi:hypothetical protein
MIAKAIKQRKQSKLFRQLTIQEMCKLIILAGELVGVPPEKMPGKDGTVLIANFATLHYGHFTVEEIKTAFMLAAAGELEAEGHYQVFSAKYFGAVMNAYKVRGNQVAKEIFEGPKELPPSEPKEADWTEAWEHIKAQAKIKPIDKVIIPVPVYDWLVKKGELKLSAEERRNLMIEAKREWIGELEMGGISAREVKKGHRQGEILSNLKPQEFHTLAALKQPISRNSEYYPELLNRAKRRALKRILEAL